MAVILEGFTDPTPLFTSGLKIDNEKYTVFKADEQAIMGRKVLPVVSLQTSR
jgi:hypothetical protein